MSMAFSFAQENVNNVNTTAMLISTASSNGFKEVSAELKFNKKKKAAVLFVCYNIWTYLEILWKK